jgi:two-component system sensor histidine kinase BaeS
LRTLRYKLTSLFLLVALAAFFLIGISANVILERQFKHYVISNLNQRISDLVLSLKHQYTGGNGAWDTVGIEQLGVNALNDGLMLRVTGSGGQIIWDAAAHNSGMCAEILHSMSENMESQYAGFDGGYMEQTSDITVDGVFAGRAAVGYYGPFFYTDSDLQFLNTLNQLLLLAAALAGILSFVLGSYMSKRITVPISRVIKTAEEISSGHYGGRVREKSNTREIVELTGAINSLAVKLGSQESLRKRLTGDVAHELRTPIANLQSHLEAMIDGIWEADADRLKNCHEETVRLTKIISDLESLARYEGEQTILVPERFDLAELARKTVKSFENEFSSKNIMLTTSLPVQSVFADKDKIMQVLVNIISNALKYTPEGGKIELSVTGDNKQVLVIVKDSGIGISKEDLPYIFERFYRADKSRSRGTGGSGIGLAIVKSLVEAHGGTVSVKSTPGEGSEFTVSLPR